MERDEYEETTIIEIMDRRGRVVQQHLRNGKVNPNYMRIYNDKVRRSEHALEVAMVQTRRTCWPVARINIFIENACGVGRPAPPFY